MANIDFQIEKPSSGLSVSGRVIMESTAPFGNVQVMLNGQSGGSYTNLERTHEIGRLLRVRSFASGYLYSLGKSGRVFFSHEC